MFDMPKEIGDFPDTNFDDCESSDFRAHAKIRLEDLQADEFIKELTREFAEYSKRDSEQQNPAVGVGVQQSEDQEVEQPEGLFASRDGAELCESFIKRILQFVVEFYDKLVNSGKAEEIYRGFKSREFRKKKFLLEAMIELLKKLLLGARTRNLLELLDEQIIELRQALESEQDPKMRKVLQERINLLMQLRTQLLNTRSVAGAEHVFRVLLAGVLTEAAMVSRSSGVTLQNSISYSAAMGRMFDISSVNFGGLARDYGSLSTDAVQGAGYQLSAQISLSSITANSTFNSAYWVASLHGVVLSEYMALNFAPNRVADFVPNVLLNAFNRMVRAIVNELAHVVSEVVKGTASFVIGSDIQRGRGTDARSLNVQRSVSEAMRSQGSATGRQHFQNAAHSDFHQQSYIRLEQEKIREGRLGSVTEIDAGYDALRAGTMTCSVTSLTYSYGSVCTEQVMRDQGHGRLRQLPDTAVEKASVTVVDPGQAVGGNRSIGSS